MSSLGDARARLIAALDAGGLAPVTTMRWAAPTVLVEPGDPWTTPQRMPGRVSRWRLTLVAGLADTEGAFERIAEGIDAIDDALRAIDGVGATTWGRILVMRNPSDPNAPAYDVCVATVEVGLP